MRQLVNKKYLRYICHIGLKELLNLKTGYLFFFYKKTSSIAGTPHPRFCICRFNQLWTENTQEKKNLRKFQKAHIEHYAKSMWMTWCIGKACCSLFANIGYIQTLCYLISGIWASSDCGIWGRSWNQSP